MNQAGKIRIAVYFAAAVFVLWPIPHVGPLLDAGAEER